MRWLVLLLACKDPPARPGHPGVVDPQRTLVRASMGLLGARPSVDELQQVAADPEALSSIVDGFLKDPRFGETIEDMHAEQFFLRWDVSGHPAPAGPLAAVANSALIDAIDDTPLKLVEWVVTEGRPYTDIVTTDVVFANRVTAIAYGLPYDPSGPEWQQSHYTDGRPAAGILGDNDVMMRFPSAPANVNRSRGHFVAQSLVCDDIGQRPLEFEVFDPLDNLEPTENPTCLACHAELDPIASAFGDFRDFLQPSEVTDAYAQGCPPDLAWACYPVQLYAPDGDQLRNPSPPAFYGTPVSDLGELGQVIADDPRFASCAARRFYSWFAQIPVEEVPFEVWSALTTDFVASGLDARELAVAAVTDPANDAVLSVRPDQYARMVEDLTGYHWAGNPDPPGCAHSADGCAGDVDLARNSLYGNHTVMGGADGYFVMDANPLPSPTRYLGQKWLAEEAASYVVYEDFSADPSDRRLFTDADLSDASDDAVRAQLRHLQMRILSEPDPDTSRAEALFATSLAHHAADSAADGDKGVQLAWRTVITALLLDDHAVTY